MAKRSIARFNGEKLLALRIERGLTQQALSDKTAERRRVHRDTISNYETGGSSPTPLNFGVLVFALGCEPADLLDEVGAGAA